MSLRSLIFGIIGAALLAPVAVVPVCAETCTIDLSLSPNPPQCGVPWLQENCSLSFVNTTAEDYTGAGYCIVTWVDVSAGTGPYVMGGRLELDLAAIDGVTSVEIDIYEAHMAGSTRAFLYSGGIQIGNASSASTLGQTLVLSAAPGASKLAVSAHEAGVWAIRLIGDTLVDGREPTWGFIKALY